MAPDDGTVALLTTFEQIGVGTTALYTCNPGYVLTGEKTRTCENSSNGMIWSRDSPTCKDNITLIFVYPTHFHNFLVPYILSLKLSGPHKLSRITCGSIIIITNNKLDFVLMLFRCNSKQLYHKLSRNSLSLSRAGMSRKR